MKGASRLSMFALVTIAACSGTQSAPDPAGPQSRQIYGLWWFFRGVCLVVYLAVILLMVAALRRRGRRRKAALLLRPPADQERRLARAVGLGVALTTVTLFALLAADFATGRAIHSLAEPDPLTIKVTGHQWWWEVQYQDRQPSRIFTPANEIHIPVGRAVRFDLDSADVIHSFRVPNLHGKRDMIPGHPASAFLRADRAGTFTGQCAELCGYHHDFIRFTVVAEPEAEFRRWADGQGARSIAPNDPWRSTVLARVETLEPTRMPPLTHEVADRQGIAVLRAWIASLPGPPVLAPPTIAPGGGEFREPVRVTLRHDDPAAVLRFTLDATAPGKMSPEYAGPFEVRQSTTVRARAYRPGQTRSITAQETLLIGD